MVSGLQFFEGLSHLYRPQFMDPWWRWYADEPSPRRALALFAAQYAYERQGAAPAYPHAAYIAIDESTTLNPSDIWQRYQTALAGAKANRWLNPLNHTTAPCNCATCGFSDSSDRLPDMVEVTRADLDGGRVRQAHDRLIRVRGIGPKIAAFFLRDASIWYGIAPSTDRELLQPVDVWVRRCVEVLGGTQVTDSGIAAWICSHSPLPEQANQGLWYFSSVIAGSEVRLRRALADEKHALDLVESYMGRLEAVAAAWTDTRSRITGT